MDAFLISTGIVALAEMGDKTQLLALLLALRFRGRPWPIVLGILAATLANHGLAGALGAWLMQWAGSSQGDYESIIRWVIGGSFLAMAVWILIPDKLDGVNVPQPARTTAWGIFATTTVLFFLAEMADKTQIATVMLAARFDNAWLAVVAGTTLGMMLANVPVVVLGERITRRLPLKPIRIVSALLFAGLGVAALWPR